jgi:polyferredoxin
MLLFPITLNYLSPYLIVNGSFEGIVSGSFMLFLGLFLSSLILGRGFCGWICPAGALQDGCAAVVDKPAKPGMNLIKYIIWVPWLGSIIAGFIAAGGIRKIDIIYMTDYGISVHAPAGYFMYFTVVVLIMVLSFTLGRRGFCHGVCWMAPFMVMGRRLADAFKLPGLRLKARPEACTGCKRCDKACPMNLAVNDMVRRGSIQNDECILCGGCADSNPNRAIRLGMHRADISGGHEKEQVSHQG